MSGEAKSVPIRWPNVSWRMRARPIIAAVLEATAGQSEQQIRRALVDAYPFGERRCYPYRAWLLEIAAQRGQRKPRRNAGPDGQGKLEL